MTKTKTFRLSQSAQAHLAVLVDLTGSTQTAVVEHALCFYRALLTGGIGAELGVDALANAPTNPKGTDRAAAHPADEQAQVVAAAPTPAENGPDECSYVHLGRTYTFSFPVKKLPRRGLSPCPCGSGKPFLMCHVRDYDQAVKPRLCFVQ